MRPLYDDFLSLPIQNFLKQRATSCHGIAGLSHIGKSGGLETPESMTFLVELYKEVAPELDHVLKQRVQDREFIDQRTKALYAFNEDYGISVTEDNYQTVLGLEDKDGRVVMGPLQKDYYRSTKEHRPVAPLPDYLKDVHVTLFGPPDSAKMCINAMNAYHRKLKGEPAIVEQLLSTHTSLPKWGADDEDSKTPLREDLISAGENLSRCFTKDLSLKEGDRVYEIGKEKLSLPIKRFPGLALPCSFLYFEDRPIPLHLYDFALHLYRNWNLPEALVFYVPKLENEEEARYIKNMIEAAERRIQAQHPTYKMGTVRLMIVLENPRAVFRVHEIMDELYPYFAGASLGWHDFLASAARAFKEDGNYRIPIKADPDIVIKYIKASHELLANVVGERGGIKVGGMYGILPLSNDLQSTSFQVTIKGYIRDVVTQLKRNLNGFWVAHPDFVRLGLALVEAWKFYQKGDRQRITDLVCALLQPQHQKEVLDFIFGPDIESLDASHPRFPRSLIVADLKQSAKMANNDVAEVRYNVFQSLQYLTDWLAGNGCVALPSHVGGAAVRVMDDLATAERSRWEVWHEIYHGRFSLEDFLKIAHEEMHFIRKDLSNDEKMVAVKWDERTAKWYPLAFKLMIKLMTDKTPVEFATQLLMPLTLDEVRNSEEPWKLLQQLDPKKYSLSREVERFNFFFEQCGHKVWAREMSQRLFFDKGLAEKRIRQFKLDDINEAAYFHGNIGEAKKTLDKTAAGEQALVLQESQSVKDELLKLGEEYKEKFGMKFLISAAGKSAEEILTQLKARMKNELPQEIENAREALWQITEKRLRAHESQNLKLKLEDLRKSFAVSGVQLSVTWDGEFVEALSLGKSSVKEDVTENTWFELASLSKTVGSAFAIDYFFKKGISLSTPVNDLLSKAGSRFRLKTKENLPAEWASHVDLSHLMRHEALNMHYVNGVPADRPMPSIEEFLMGNETYGYEPIAVINKPGEKFQYSGAGFIVLEHLISSLEGKPFKDIISPYLRELGFKNLSFDQQNLPGFSYAHGFMDDHNEIAGTRKMFPGIAAGAMGTATDTLRFLNEVTKAFHDPLRTGPLSHDAAVLMLQGFDKGSQEFMGARMGLGVFVTDAGPNKIMIHQGANDGFRGIFIHCFSGPQRGQGLVAFVNAELQGVRFISALVQELLKEFQWQGVDLEKFKSQFDPRNLKQEEVVNRGYKELIFSAFEPLLPAPIPRRGALDPLAKYNKVIGSEILSVTNQIFARAENLIDPRLPVFEPDLYCDQGKVMDSWESARHNPKESEDLVLKLPTPTAVKYVRFSTQYHFGNQVPKVSLEGFDETSGQWIEIVSPTVLDGHCTKSLLVEKGLGKLFSRLKVRTYPDGGLTRLGVFDDSLPSDQRSNFLPESRAVCLPCADKIPQTHKPLTLPFDQRLQSVCEQKAKQKAEINMASLALGAKVIRVSNEHYSPASQVLSPFPPLHMFDGFESARSRQPGHTEECVIQLAQPCRPHRVEFDFTYFVNNNPKSIKVEGKKGSSWEVLIPETSVKAFAGNKRIFYLQPVSSPIDQVKITVFPDGGINRFKVFAEPS